MRRLALIGATPDFRVRSPLCSVARSLHFLRNADRMAVLIGWSHGMDKQPDETNKPEPSLFDGIPDTVSQPPDGNRVVTIPLAEIPAPQRDPLAGTASASLVANEPEPAAPQPEPAASQPKPAASGNITPPVHMPAEAGVAIPSVVNASYRESSVPAEALPPEQRVATNMDNPEPAPSPAAAVEVTSALAYASRSTHRQRPSTGAWWTIPMICVGLALVACALIIGQVEANRQVAWRRNKLKIDLEYLQEQVRQNEDSLKWMQTNPTMSERLAQRQMNQVRAGSAILQVPGLPHQKDRNPFQLTTIPPPKPLAPYEPRGDLLTFLFADPRHALWAIGIGLMMVAAGLVLGGPNEPAEERKAQ